MPEKNKMKFKVVKADIQDAKKGYVRIPSDDMALLGLKPNDVVKITGKRSTVAKILPGFPASCPAGCIQMDGVIRQNAGTGLGNTVEVVPDEAQEARSVVLAPILPDFQQERHVPAAIKKNLLGRVIATGDRVSVPQFSGGDEIFSVEGTAPRGPVVITRDTIIRIKGAENPEVHREKVTYEDIGG
ncbi:MAG: transitional endoplasmic reticulum ATPase [Tepidanaerobacteraceae bacterium]|nr:transitional endoplasmic reticulum ATPase [Tepidanaerobacteraceae bacterium]